MITRAGILGNGKIADRKPASGDPALRRKSTACDEKPSVIYEMSAWTINGGNQETHTAVS